RAFIAALKAPEDVVSNQAFNVGQTAHNYTIRQIAEIVGEVVPGCRLEIASDAGPDARSYRVNFDKIANALPAFKPQWDVRRGAEQLYAAYKSHGLTLDEFEGQSFNRIAHVMMLLKDGLLDSEIRPVRPAA